VRNLAAPLVKSLLFILVTAVATVVLAFSITGGSVGGGQQYGATFLDATSLNVGDDVRISGVKVGQIESLDVVGHNRAHVGFSLEDGRTVPADVHAVIKYRNMVGQRYLALERSGTGGGGVLPPGGEIPLDRTTPALDLTELFNGFKPLFQALSPKDVNSLSGEIVQVLQGEGGTVTELLAHTGSLTSTLADRDQVIGRVIGNLNSVLKTVNGKGDALTTLVSTLRQLVSGLADRTAIGDAVSGLADLTQSTSGLLTEVRPGLKDSIAGLDRLSQNLNEGKADVDRFLTTLPQKMNGIGRIGSYGSWMNFYLCSATLQSSPPRGVPATAARCGS